MTLVRFLLRESRGVVLAAVVAGACGGAASVALVALIHAELGRASPSGPALAATFAALCLLSALLRVAAQVALARLGQGSVMRLTLHLCRKILALPLEAFEAADRSALVAVLTEDVVVVANALVGVPLLCINVPVAVACFAYVGTVSPAVLACGLTFAALAIGAYVALAERAGGRLRAARAVQDALVGHFRTILEGFRELKQHRGRRTALLDDGLAPAASAARDHTASALTIFAVAEGWSGLAFFGFLGFLLFVLPAFRPMPRADLAGAVLVVLYLMSPLDVIVTWMPALSRARASIRRIEALIPALEADGRDEAEPAANPAVVLDSVALEGIAYAYQNDADADAEGFELGPVDLTLRTGEVVMLAGGNGSGKTTLVKLLTGLYRPASGTVEVDGRAVGADEAGREAYRQLFTVLFADGHLFTDLAGPDLDEAARAGLDRLGLGGRVRVANGSFSTTDLSQGQRRRLALLAALLEDRPVLVFDEWAANQDGRFKRFFYRELLPELRAEGKAVLVVSHDEEFYDAADRVVRLRAGRVVAAEGAPQAVGPGRA